MRIVLDVETRAEESVVDIGPRRYVEQPSFEVLCVSWCVGERGAWSPVRVAVTCGGSDGRAAIERRVIEAGWEVRPLSVFWDEFVRAGVKIAHNKGFEEAVIDRWWPSRPFVEWSCTASRARRLSLPGSLADACRVLRTPHQKSDEGHGVMLQCSQPRPVWRRSGGPKWFEDANRLARTAVYCGQDILAERDLDDYLPELSPSERAYWSLTELCNRRGLRLDRALIDAMIAAVNDDVEQALADARQATGDAEFELTNPTKIKAFCASRGVPLADLTKETVAVALAAHDSGARPLHEDARVVLLARQQVGGKTSTAKLPRMRERLCDDGVARDLVIYHGAHTGRTTGDGINMLNLPRPYRGFDQDLVCELLLQNRASEIRERQKVSASAAVSSVLRGVIVPDPGRQFVIGDYSSVEPCFSFTLAEQWDAVAVLRAGENLYIEFGKTIYGRILDKIQDLKEYTICKNTILGCGYGLGATRFVDYLALAGVVLSREESDRIHASYRQRFPGIPRSWRGLEEAAKASLRSPGDRYRFNGVEYISDGWWLVCVLPSGRPFYYPNARLQPGKYNEEIVYEGWMRIDGRPAGWGDVRTWGGSLLENVTQAACRDIMEEHQQDVEARLGWEMRLTVYDELVVECPSEETEAARTLEAIMSRSPAWMPHMPVSAKAFTSNRYKKD